MKDDSKHLKMNEEKWDTWADSLDKKSWQSDYLRNAQSQVISLLNMQPGAHFLDVGCGTGWAVGQAAMQVGDQGLFYGVDLSPKMIEKAKANFSGRDHLFFMQANVEAISLEGDFFDIIICTNSFHHYLHAEKALKEMYRLLRSGGKVYILDPTADAWVMKLADKIIKIAEPEHVKMYSTREFKQLLAQAGLRYSNAKTANGRQSIHIGEK
ncbi:MAG: class I SAM-dependent methyltransferase [Bacteroidota bacterium]